MIDTVTLSALIFVAALLYSSVGHAGASGYLAAMSFYKLPASVMRPAALTLNVIVASVGTYRFWRAGHLSWRLLWPIAVLAAPMAFVGGRWPLSETIYYRALGVVLCLAAINLIVQVMWPRRFGGRVSGVHPPPIVVALLVGAGLGLLAGLTGVGGGIFLSPVLLLMGWADPKKTAGVSAAFILINSIAGLAGQIFSGQFKPLRALPLEFLLWGAAALAGGMIGSWLGARRLPNPALRALLAVVLLIAGVKMVLA
jgi:uncharacterized protein